VNPASKIFQKTSKEAIVNYFVLMYYAYL